MAASRALLALLTLIPFLATTVFPSVLTPGVLPLIVRNPYLSVWLPNAREAPWHRWPIFYTGQEIGLSVMLSVSQTKHIYPLLGRPQDSLPEELLINGTLQYPRYQGATYDASTTNLTYLINAPHGSPSAPAQVKLSFLSPITPTSTLRQSLPAGYINVEIQGDFDVDVYIDINGQWATGDRGASIEWQLWQPWSFNGEEEVVRSWAIKRAQDALFTEYADRAEWGQVHFSAPKGTAFQAGESAQVRQQFATGGTLGDADDRRWRTVMEEEPVFAFARHFHLSGGQHEDSVVFSLAHVQDPVVQFAAERGLTNMRPLWMSYFKQHSQLDDMLVFHYLDFATASLLAGNYSSQLHSDALTAQGPEYADLVALAARQVLGATTFAGTLSNPLIFLKEISSNGNCQTVDVIYPAFPFFLYTSPRWLAYLLEPLLEHQLSGQYPNRYSMHDLGAHFPNMTGHPDGWDEYMPVEECGNMLIMGAALVNSLGYDSPEASGSLWSSLGSAPPPTADTAYPFALSEPSATDSIFGLDSAWGGGASGATQASQWLTRTYTLWKQWTTYLIDFSLLPDTQLCTDDFAGWLANNTNLALKGIVGIRAMADLAAAASVGSDAEAAYYRNVSETYVRLWEEYGMSRDGGHAKLAYTWYGSWGTMYNLFADALLCFHLPSASSSSSTPSSSSSSSSSSSQPRSFTQKPMHPFSSPSPATSPFVPHHIYSTQSTFYPLTLQKFGLPLDSRHLYTKSDWSFWAAAVASRKTRTAIVDATARWVNETVIVDRPMTDLFQTEGEGGFRDVPTFMARPVVGGFFARLALGRACGGRAVGGLAFLDGEDEGGEGEGGSPGSVG